MSNPTTPFSWQMPTSTDLVTDLPADFEVFGQAVATDLADLLGGTTGQILSKTSATDMDFTWITNDVGDITAVNTTAPLAGGATSGAVTLSVTTATTSATGVVQLSDSTSTTSSVLAATPTAVKSAYDLANGAIPKTLTTTTGDTIYASAANTPARLGVGSTGQVLTVAGGIPSWATPAGAPAKAYTLVNAGGTALSGTSVSITGLSTYDDLLIIVRGASCTAASQSMYMSVNSVTSANSYTRAGMVTSFGSTYSNAISSTANSSDTEIRLGTMSNNADSTVSGGVSISGCRGTGVKPLDVAFGSDVGSGTTGAGAIVYKGVINATTAISSVQVFSGTFDAGTVFVYGAV